MTRTHDDWEAARVRRDRSAIASARALVAGNEADAIDAALVAVAADDEMFAISKELDG